MKKRRKHSRCLNCSEPLERTFNYCPNCGQENTDHHVSVSLLLREFTNNFFSLDSRFAHTIVPFLIRPGKVTKAFIEGKRVYYANPIRWYLVISIFHFFFLAKVFQPTVHDKKNRLFDRDEEVSTTKFDSLYHLPDSVHDGWPLSNSRQLMVNHLIATTDLSPDQILDSLKIRKNHWARDFATKKLITIAMETTASLNGYILRQIPIIIFFILPVYAWLLKLFFWRKGLYIKHLIHSIHLHSFYFFLTGWVWVLALLFPDFEDYGLPITAGLTFIYAALSFKKVYQIKLRWSLFRAMWIGFFYSIALAIFFVLGILVSFAFI